MPKGAFKQKALAHADSSARKAESHFGWNRQCIRRGLFVNRNGTEMKSNTFSRRIWTCSRGLC